MPYVNENNFWISFAYEKKKNKWTEYTWCRQKTKLSTNDYSLKEHGWGEEEEMEVKKRTKKKLINLSWEKNY